MLKQRKGGGAMSKVCYSERLYAKLLLKEIQKTKLALDTATNNFENMIEPDLIDCCIYELKAAQTRYEFLLNEARIYNLNCCFDVFTQETEPKKSEKSFLWFLDKKQA